MSAFLTAILGKIDAFVERLQTGPTRLDLQPVPVRRRVSPPPMAPRLDDLDLR